MSPSGDVYLYDRADQVTIQITHATGSVTYSGVSISQDGRYVVYQSSGGDVSVYDRVANTTSLVRQFSGNAHIDGAGNLIVMEGGVDDQGNVGIFVTDHTGNVLTQVSGDTNSVTNSVLTPEINADGRFITFRSAATELTVQYHDALGHLVTQTFNENSGGNEQIYVYDRSHPTHRLK